ncbi:uncharacterized protein LOC117647730 [Thrips palmi]|uniref:Uncharacterized protein LOC117647730 n=1 Tax=Thrips palmi TaxID=161013 RepID=A0A6P8ZBR6_THRPL|nr:uncharacterized protein LOC117647730 [Thrips palmi]
MDEQGALLGRRRRYRKRRRDSSFIKQVRVDCGESSNSVNESDSSDSVTSNLQKRCNTVKCADSEAQSPENVRITEESQNSSHHLDRGSDNNHAEESRSPSPHNTSALTRRSDASESNDDGTEEQTRIVDQERDKNFPGNNCEIGDNFRHQDIDANERDVNNSNHGGLEERNHYEHHERADNFLVHNCEIGDNLHQQDTDHHEQAGNKSNDEHEDYEEFRHEQRNSADGMDERSEEGESHAGEESDDTGSAGNEGDTADEASNEEEDSNHEDDGSPTEGDNAESEDEQNGNDEEEGTDNEDDGSATDGDNTESEGEQSENGDEVQDDNPDDEPLYNGARVTFRESLLTILTFILTHKLTGLALGDLLSLIELHCGPDNLCVRTTYMFKKYFKMIGKDFINCCYYCSVCQVPLERKDSICPICNGQHDIAYFIEFPIATQLKKMFARQGFYDFIQYRFNRTKQHDDNIEDVYDGSIYQECTNSGFLANPNNISFFTFFDGVSLFKKSSFSIWPLYLTINELKYSQRTRKENIILAGIWFGKSKPNPNLFLQPISQSLLSLENDGVDVSLHNGENINVKGKLIGAVADMPAKSLFMRLNQYNGAFSCFYCMAEGARFDLGNRNHNTLQVFPYSREINLRNHNDVDDIARQATALREIDPEATVYGCKGPSLLLNMLPHKIFSIGADIMHGVFLGAMSTLMGLWFDSQYSDCDFSVSNMTGIVDQRLKSIKPPISFRQPKSLKKEMAHMKASDFKVFFFHYSLPVLLGVLPEIYWFHHCKLVAAIALLCQDSTSLLELEEAEELLHSYVSDFADLYGIRYLTLTFHQLLHFPLLVRHLGPMFVYSCFFYESLNGQFARLVHGSRHVALQIVSSCSILMNLPVMISGMDQGRAKNLCLKFQGSLKKNIRVTENINDSAGVVGKLKPLLVTVRIRRLVQDTFNVLGGRYLFFHRLKIKNFVYCAESYQRSQKNLACYALINHENAPYLCKIKFFIKWSSCQVICPVPCDNNCPKMYICIVNLYDRVGWKIHDAPQNIPLYYLDQVGRTNETRTFLVTSISSPCLFMNIDGNTMYMTTDVNKLEVE